jgi:hypothetical protein
MHRFFTKICLNRYRSREGAKEDNQSDGGGNIRPETINDFLPRNRYDREFESFDDV